MKKTLELCLLCTHTTKKPKTLRSQNPHTAKTQKNTTAEPLRFLLPYNQRTKKSKSRVFAGFLARHCHLENQTARLARVAPDKPRTLYSPLSPFRLTLKTKIWLADTQKGTAVRP